MNTHVPLTRDDHDIFVRVTAGAQWRYHAADRRDALIMRALSARKVLL